MRLLLVEDDSQLAEWLKKDLKQAGFAVDLASDGIDAQHLGNTEPYDVVVLDLGLPGIPGLTVLQHWREHGNTTPVIILTARSAWHEKVEGFKAGADDYLAKPFHSEELIARINALVRRSAGRAQSNVKFGALTLDEDKQTLTTTDGQSHTLTGTEFRLIRYFMANPEKVLSKTRLAEHIYDYDSEKDSNVIEVYVKRLRHILGPQWIQTRRGQGYVFTQPKT